MINIFEKANNIVVTVADGKICINLEMTVNGGVIMINADDVRCPLAVCLW